jgi:hypothetical protein
MDDPNKLDTLDICIIRATLLARLAKKPEYTIFTITIANIKKALALKKHTDPATKVLIEYYNLLDVFLQKEADKLPERRPYDYKIVIEEGKYSGFGPLYRIS